MLPRNRAWLGAIAAATLTWGAAPTSAGPPQDGPVQLQQLVKKFEDARSALYERLDGLEGEARQKMYEGAPWAEYVEAFRECAYETEGETAAQAWVWVVRVGKEFLPEDATEAVDNLLAAHLDAEAMAELVDELTYPARIDAQAAEDALAKIAADAPSAKVRAVARFNLAATLMDEGQATGERRERARELLLGLREGEFATVVPAERLERSLFELENLMIGMEAPDFEAVDADGVEFKLSDYRGKVVVVDFWGFW